MNRLPFISLTILAGTASWLFSAVPQNPDSTIIDSPTVNISVDTIDSVKISSEEVPSIEHIETPVVENPGFSIILSDAKEFFLEALIADHHNDTLEVVYLIDKIVVLLNQAKQLGEMSADDKEEFDRFETTLLNSYENHFKSIPQGETPIAMASLREELAEYLEPLEYEINGNKFQVIDDREGHIPLIMNSRVEQVVKFFQTKGRRTFQTWLSRYPRYKDLITKILKRNDLPEELICLAMIESGLNPKAYSRAHAAGMWQFIRSTAKIYGLKYTYWIDERRDPEKATNAAAAFLKDLLLEYEDSGSRWYLALAAYNSGSARVNRAIRLHGTREFWRLHSLPRETRDYVPNFLAAAIIFRDPEKYGFKIPSTKEISLDEVVIEKSADLTVLAGCADISVKKLKQINPELRQFATPPDKPYTLKLPAGKSEMFTAEFNALPESNRFAPQYRQHRVRPGESLSAIANKYRVSMHELASVNKITNYNQISEGTKLTIPVPSSAASGPVATASPKKPQETISYKVRSGDTLGHIAERYGTSARDIRQWNGLKYGAYIYPGQKLTIPKKSSSKLASSVKGGSDKEIYVVREGDTLGHIATRYRVDINKIERWNNISRKRAIRPGQKLVIHIK